MSGCGAGDVGSSRPTPERLEHRCGETAIAWCACGWCEELPVRLALPLAQAHMASGEHVVLTELALWLRGLGVELPAR